MAFHHRYKTRLPLLLYGDLSAREREDLDKHLASCPSCRGDLDEMRRLHALLSRAPVPAPNEAELRAARMQFHAALAARRNRLSLGDRLADLFPFPVSLRPAFALGAAALLVAGFSIGRFTVRPAENAESEPSLAASGAGRITNVRFLSTDQRGGDVELAYDAVLPVRIHGSLTDPAIQKALAYALVNSDNAGVRIRAAGTVVATQSSPPEREVKAALLLAMTSDRNDGVRQEALRALLRYAGDREVRDALLYVLLNDRNPGLRVAAINALDTLRSRGYVPDENQRKTIRGLRNSDQSVYVRVKAQSLLEERIQ